MNDRFKIVLGVINIILNQKGQVLLLLRKNKFDAGLYSIPGGCVEEIETVKYNAVKEIKEETNLDVKEEDVSIISSMYRNTASWHAVELVSVVKRFSGELKNMEPDKSEKLEWFDLDKLPDNMSLYALNAINNFKNGTVFNEVNY